LALGRSSGRSALTASEAVLIAQAQEDYAADELPEMSVADLAANFADFWTFAARRPARGPMIRVVAAIDADGHSLPRTRIEIVQDDGPFLVDSVMGEIAQSGLAVRAMFHAVVVVARDAAGERTTDGEARPESMIEVVVDPIAEDQIDVLTANLLATLADVRMAVGDFRPMLALMDRAIDEIGAASPGVEAEALAEYVSFLQWLREDHFIFLGAREYDYPRTSDGGYAAEEPVHRPEDSLGVLRDQQRLVLRRTSEPAILNPHLEQGPPLIVAKSNLKSRVHRRAYMDYVGVRRFGPDGRPSGEIRFVGLFTAEAYDTTVGEAPLVRRKVERVRARAGKVVGGHSDRRLHNILENYPRDELFQIGEDELLATALGILHLNDRPRLRLFSRHDPFDRFVSILLFLPREAYRAEIEVRAGQIMAEAYHGRVSAFYPSFTDAPLARVHYIIGITPGDHPSPDIYVLEGEIAEAARTWDDRFEQAVREDARTHAQAGELLSRYAGGFPLGYQDLYDAGEAITDILAIEALARDEPVGVRAFNREDDPARRFRFKLYRPAEAAPLAEVLPILDSMGLKALVEEGFPIRRRVADGAATVVWTHEFELDDPHGEALALTEVQRPFEEAFAAVWAGRTESDGFNRLVLELGCSWRQAALVRALARYRQQSGLDPSQAVQEAALRDNPGVARLILDLFRTKFDPAITASPSARREQATAVMDKVVEALQAVESLDADRVLRRLALLAMALTRTNYYQLGADGQPKPYISFKIASGQLDDLPSPKPFREIFVWAPHVEGVHLRFGPVARGGLRWSDRRDDFRTEILGLVKAQQVKNAVIVPVGSKGGFYPKQLPRGGASEAVLAEAIRAYRTFLFGLLDLTDNLSVKGEVIHPDGVVVLDDDDPYLVVAADKGTASFSDIANAVAESYGFWLGDAFASGGSAGYDHKAMGITARGAWEAVKRHFRELGRDIQADPFTVIGVGDMSGDVFGNGMLLSRQIRLVAAFDHRDIFIDPNPDQAASFAERKRLFDLPRSSWADYDHSLISQGGGVFSRSHKSVTLTDEIRRLLDIEAETLTPAELINAVLKAKADLLYLGGVGTYVKAARESHLDVGDKANDAVRVDATQLRCLVVGEGANLGVTQAGRVAFARAGGRIDTDAIDNSAGVDTSDHEVNIKILTGMLERAGELTRKRRDKLLQSMTDEVASHVLQHNYDQTLALSLMERGAPAELHQHAGFMAALEAKGRLDRDVEGLPGRAELGELAQGGLGLTRPELAVLLAYGKIDLFDDLIVSNAPDDLYFLGALEAYFPKPLRKYADAMKRHRLRREIIATMLDNDMVNICGPTFPRRLCASAGCDVAALATGYAAAKAILRFDDVWRQVAALDGQVPAAAQMAMFAELASVLRGQTFWMARRVAGKTAPRRSGRAAKTEMSVRRLIDAYRPAVDALKSIIPDVLSPMERQGVEGDALAFVDAGAPQALARQVAALRPLTTVADLCDLAAESRWPVAAVARIHHQVGGDFGFDVLRAAAGALQTGDPFERLAVRRLVEELLSEQTALTRAVMAFAAGPQAAEDAAATIASWAALRAQAVRAVKDTLADIQDAGEGWSFAKLTIANAVLRELATAATR
jgi:glutamate dehydrogenase